MKRIVLNTGRAIGKSQLILDKLRFMLEIKLRSLRMTIKEVIEAVEVDDARDMDILKAYELNKNIKSMEKRNVRSSTN